MSRSGRFEGIAPQQRPAYSTYARVAIERAGRALTADELAAALPKTTGGTDRRPTPGALAQLREHRADLFEHPARLAAFWTNRDD
jgi:hypothetical protein